MGFNYAREKRKFEEYWERVRRQCEMAGMSQDAIEKLHEFDWNWFKSRRRYISHLAELSDSVTLEDLPQRDVEWSTGDTPLCYGAGCMESAERFHWIDEIEDEVLLQKLMLLDTSDLELLTCVVFEGYTQREIVHRRGQTQQAISSRFSQIKKFLGKRL